MRGQTLANVNANVMAAHGKPDSLEPQTYHAHNSEGSETNHLASLIQSIKRGDIESVVQILDSVPKSVLQSSDADQIPPLIWAVKKLQKDIVTLLIDRGMNVNQKGIYCIYSVVNTLTPLLEAVRRKDIEMVKLLLSKGADPYLYVSKARMLSQRNGCLGWYYPITEAIKTTRIQLVRMILERYNPRTRLSIHFYQGQGANYTEDGHTCLCFALSVPRRRLQTVNWLQIIKCIILYGGRLCDKARCSQLDMLVNTVFLKQGVDGEMKFSCSFTSFKVLKLILETHNKKYWFDVVKTIKESILCQSSSEEGSLETAFYCVESENCFRYLVSYMSTPASLGHMCRVVIRQSMRGPGLVSTVCKKLPLPPKLQAFVASIDD